MTYDVHAESRRKLAEKTVYTVGEVHDKVVLLKENLWHVLNDYRTGNIGFKTIRRAMACFKIMRELPEPTKENCKYQNTHYLIDYRDDFFNRLDMPTRDWILEALFKFFIIVYEYDPPYRHFIDYLLQSIKDNDKWLPLKEGFPNRWWNKEEQ